MNIGYQILSIRKEHQLTQEQFGEIFHVTRQTVSNWENGKSYPELQLLVDISDKFEVSLDTLLKGDSKMVSVIDKERLLGRIRRERTIADSFTGAGTGILASCLFSPNTTARTVMIVLGFVLISVGWYKKASYEKKAIKAMEES